MLAKYKDHEFRNAIILAAVAIVSALLALLFVFSPDNLLVFREVALLLANLWWLILPIPMWFIFYMTHSEYVALMWVIKQKSLVLEIKVPSDTEKSPKIMKQVIVSLHDYTTLSRFEIYCGWRPLQNKYALEIASLEGAVHFYLRCPAGARNGVEALIYAHYPDAEIYEVEDYTRIVPKYLPNAEWDVWGVTMRLVKPDAYPLRTYQHFKEDITGKMIDPLASMIEAMSHAGKKQYVWLQIMLTSAAEPEWQPAAVAEMNKIMKIPEETKKTGINAIGSEAGYLVGNIFRGVAGSELAGPAEAKKEDFNIQKLTPQAQETLQAIVESISDIAFRALMRMVYVGHKSHWDKSVGVGGVLNALKQTSDNNLNSLRADNITKTFAQYYFEEPRLKYRQRKIVQNYRDRDYAGLGYYLTSDELATLYHYPDMSVKAPTVNRVEAKKGDAPANLPVEFE